jgi:hypothetical protein
VDKVAVANAVIEGPINLETLDLQEQIERLKDFVLGSNTE